jgi:hypothetical protein
MPTLEQSLAGIPIYRSLLGQQQFNQQQEAGALSNATRRQGLLQAIQAQQEQEQLKGILSQTGGDPEKARKALFAHGSPTAVKLAAQLKGMVQKPGLQQIGSGGAIGPGGELIPPMARPQPTEQWSPPYQLGGATVQKNLATGQIRTAVSREPNAQGRPLPSPLQKQLTEVSELADATDRFDSTFKDTYGGKTITGELSNVTGKYFGDNTGQSQWWQDYELHQSQVRNKLFGSALTAPEIAAWNKSAINPRMDPGQIKANLGRRKELEQRAVNRLMRGAAVTYNKEQIEAFTGRPISEEQTERRAVPRSPTKRIVVDY